MKCVRFAFFRCVQRICTSHFWGNPNSFLILYKTRVMCEKSELILSTSDNFQRWPRIPNFMEIRRLLLSTNVDRLREMIHRWWHSLRNDCRVKGCCLTATKYYVSTCCLSNLFKIYTSYLQLDPIAPVEIQRMVTFSSEHPRVSEIDTLFSMEFSRSSLCLLTKSHDVIIEVAVVRR
jgi:hypothetical protein